MEEFNDRQLQMADLQEKSSLELEIRSKSDLKNQNHTQKNDQLLKGEVLHFQLVILTATYLFIPNNLFLENFCLNMKRLYHISAQS